MSRFPEDIGELLDTDPMALGDRCMAAEDEARQLKRERDELRELLGEVLDRFWQKGHPGHPCVRTGWIAVETVEGWRATLKGEA